MNDHKLQARGITRIQLPRAISSQLPTKPSGAREKKQGRREDRGPPSRAEFGSERPRPVLRAPNGWPLRALFRICFLR